MLSVRATAERAVDVAREDTLNTARREIDRKFNERAGSMAIAGIFATKLCVKCGHPARLRFTRRTFTRLRPFAFALGYTGTASDSMCPFSPLGATAAAVLASLPTMAGSRYAVRIVCSTLSSCSIDMMAKSSHMLLLSEPPIA